MAGMDHYLPIAEHGLIGDLHSVALVGTDGTIDWYCCPRFDSRDITMGLESTVPLKVTGAGAVTASFALRENETATFILERVPEGFVPRHHHHDETRELFDGTVAYWRRWLAQSGYRGRWR